MVVSAKNGSMQAVAGSGIKFMSDSLIAFQPAIEEPSNILPSEKVSSSIILTSKDTRCHAPRGSVKRKSTYLTSLSLIIFRTSLGVVMEWIPLSSMRKWKCDRWDWRSDGVQPGFPRPDPNCFLDIGDEDLAVADAARLRSPAYGFDGFFDHVVA